MLMTTRPTVKNKILFFLKHHPGWHSGTELEDQARFWQCKPSMISRRARELADEGKIQRRLSIRRTVEYAHN